MLGSIGPLEDCYRPELAPPPVECEREHDEMIGHLLDADVDLLFIETMNNQAEASIAAACAERAAPGRWMICFCTKSDGPPGILLNGGPLLDVEPVLERAHAVGINCAPPASIAAQLDVLRAVLPETPTSAETARLRISSGAITAFETR